MSNKAWDLISYNQSAACRRNIEFTEYLREQGHYCPFCHSERLQVIRTEHVLGDIYNTVLCNDCEKLWTDKFTLVDAYL